MLRLLLESGANIDAQDSDGNTALILAVRQNLVSVVALLLEAGARLELETAKGESALSIAMHFGDGGCLSLLTAKTAERLGWNALLLHSAQYGDEAKMRQWIERSAAGDADIDLDYTDAAGRSALMLAARGGHAGCVALLLQAGASVRLLDRDDCSALVIAIRNGFKDIAEMIARWGDETGEQHAPGRQRDTRARRQAADVAADGGGSEMENCTRFLLRLGMRLSAQLEAEQAQRDGPAQQQQC